MQTKKQSLIESLTNVAIGYTISLISLFVIFPILGIASSAGKNILITCYFTLISILGSYIVRRWFNKRKNTSIALTNLKNLQKLKSQKMPLVTGATLHCFHCFHCEIEANVKCKNNFYYCGNCGLRH